MTSQRFLSFPQRRESRILWIPAFAGMTVTMLCLMAPLHAEEPKISVKAEVNKAFITIGDPVIYTVTVKHHKDIKLTSSLTPPSDPSFKVKKSEDFTKKENNFIYEIKKTTLTAFSLGDFVLDPVEVHYLDSDGQNKKIQTDKIYLSVKSVSGKEEKKDIRGVKPVIEIPKKYLPYVYGGSGLLIAGLLLLLFLKRKKPAGDEAPALNRSFEEETLFQLNQLFDSDLIRRGKVKEYYLKLSEILRLYFERRFKIQAAEATTYEIQKMLHAKEIDPALRDLITEVLEASDLAKFAKWKPEPIEIVQINQKTKQILEMAKPKEETSNV